LMLLCAFFEGGLTVLRMYLFAGTANRVDLHLGIEIVRHLLRLPLSFFEKRPVGELSVRLSELENIRQFLTGTALTVVLDVVFSVFYIGVMFLYSAKLALCVLLTVPIVIASTLLVSTIQQKLIRTQADHHSKVQSYLVEILGGIFTVKAQHIESLVEATWRDRYVQYLTVGFQTSTVSTLFGSFSSFLSTVSSLLVLWVGADLVLQGELTLGGLIAFRILAGYVTTPLLRLAGLWQNFQETSLSMELLADIADSPTEELCHEVQLQMPVLQGRVQYDQVCFSFQPGSLQLDQVTLDIPAGAFVGIVGQSGSGKSTLMKLLPRLYSLQSGKIYLDGYDVSKVNLSSLRQQIGIVPQDAVLFEGSIRDNIALFSTLSDEEVIEAARVAEAHDFIMQLPDGYRTQVGERGGSLSGGQRQRIAIARVVARNPRLLIFDEATSALDYETEKRVCENLMRRFGDRTCFFITHRLNTITRSDQILFMQAGKIVEQGTHQELMANRQLYYCLYMQQAQF
ncbi:MAG TPA: peptidase domain-containing ABC transporter, partial [Allocoleopsis sp.]